MAELKEFIRELPPSARQLFWDLFRRKLVSKTVLRKELNSYIVLVKATAASGGVVNEALARDLARRLATLLKDLDDGLEEFDQRLIHAAVRYFVEDDDGDADFDSEQGYEDDVEVFNAVAERLGHEDLQIDLIWG